jgi:CelD/BcsL family acetyltransferase involved in cellulose biosynthesis
MNVLALRPRPDTGRPMPVVDGHVARVDVIEDMAAAEPHWRALEAGHNLSTPYQRYDFLNFWQRHVGAAAGVTPFIVVGFNAAGSPLFLWPFGRRTLAGRSVVEFLGGKHANFNMGMWRRDVIPGIQDGDLRAVLARLSGRADLLRLINQPLTWAGTTNPFALLPHQRSANYGFSGALIPDFDALLRAHTNSATRKKMRKKERALASFGTVSFTQARETGEVRRLLDVFFKQKSARMRMLGVSDAFAPPSVRRFIEAAATERLAGGEPLIEIYALSVGDIVVAIYGGIVGGGRFSAMFNSIILDRYAAESPGEQLLVRLVQHCCERGLDCFDLGIGEANYKTLFCNDAEPLFDSHLPLSTGGRLLGAAMAAAGAAKRSIKGHAALWSLVRAARRLRARLSSNI